MIQHRAAHNSRRSARRRMRRPRKPQQISRNVKSIGLPVPLAFAAVGAEFFGGLGLIVGLLSRVAAIGIGVTMLSAIVMVNGRYGLFLNWFGDKKGHGYEYHLLAIALAAVIVVRGSGAMSLDRLLYISFPCAG